MTDNTTQKAKVAPVQLGKDLVIKGLKLPNGTFGIAYPQIADMVITGDEKKDGFRTSKSQFSQTLKRLFGEDFKTFRAKTELGNQAINVVTLQEFKKIVSLFAYKGNYKAIELYNHFNPDYPINLKEITRKTPKQKEKEFQQKLAEQLGGEMEVVCKNGIADIISPKKIVEVKTVKDWKNAIGQVYVYGLDFPDKEKVIALFGGCSENAKTMITNACNELNISVIFL